VLLVTGLAVPAQQGKKKPRTVYKHGPDSMEQPDVPRGKVTQMPVWKSKVFPGTERDWWLYVPAQYDGKSPACVMVFQDGKGYVDPKGAFKTTIVFDNLIHQKKIPVMVGVFINPGVIKKPGGATASNRSFEYDTLSNQYDTF